jgi:hypothetical protein
MFRCGEVYTSVCTSLLLRKVLFVVSLEVDNFTSFFKKFSPVTIILMNDEVFMRLAIEEAQHADLRHLQKVISDA